MIGVLSLTTSSEKLCDCGHRPRATTLAGDPNIEDLKGVVQHGSVLGITLWLLFKKLIDALFLIPHNQQLSFRFLLHKNSRLSLSARPQLCKDNNGNAGESCASWTRKRKSIE
jgi:hypothetical protein